MTVATPGPDAREPIVMGEQSILIAGAPPRCVGYVALQNPTATAQRVKGMILRSDAEALFVSGCPEPGPLLLSSEGAHERATVAQLEKLCAPADRGLRELPLRAYGRLPPRACADVNVELSLHPATAPGIYSAAIEYPRGSVTPATVQVFENRQTRLHPATIPLTVELGEKLSVEVSAKNLGNVETTIARGVVVSLRAADESWHQHLHRAAAGSGEQGHGPVLDEFVKRMGENELRPTRAKVTAGAGPLAPMASRLLRVELTVPASLAKGRSYFAVLRLGDGQLTFALRTLAASDTTNDGEVL
jgi:hypothetical protein